MSNRKGRGNYLDLGKPDINDYWKPPDCERLDTDAYDHGKPFDIIRYPDGSIKDAIFYVGCKLFPAISEREFEENGRKTTDCNEGCLGYRPKNRR